MAVRSGPCPSCGTEVVETICDGCTAVHQRGDKSWWIVIVRPFGWRVEVLHDRFDACSKKCCDEIVRDAADRVVAVFAPDFAGVTYSSATHQKPRMPCGRETKKPTEEVAG